MACLFFFTCRQIKLLRFDYIVKISIFFILLCLASIELFSNNSENNNPENLEYDNFFKSALKFIPNNPDSAIIVLNNGIKLSQINNEIYYKAKLTALLGYVYFTDMQYDKASEYTQRSIAILEKTDSLKILSSAYETLGLIYNKTGNYDKALGLNFKALQLNEKIGNKKKQAVTLLNIGAIYSNKGGLDSSVFYLFNSLKIFEKLNDTLNIATTMQNIGILYNKLKEYDNELKYLKSSLDYAKEINNPRTTTAIYNNIGISLKNMNDFDESLKYYKKAIELSLKSNDKNGLGYAYNNTGQLYELMNNYDKAIEYYMLSYNLRKDTDDKKNIAKSLLNIGSLYTKKADNKQALSFYKKTLEIAEKIDSKNLLLEIYDALNDFYVINNKYKLAHKYQQKSIILKDSILNLEKYNSIAELQTKYETEKKVQEIKILNQKNNIKDLELKKQFYFKIILSVVIFSLIIILLLIFNKFRLKRKANLLISKQKQKVELINEELNTSNDNLIITNELLSEANTTKDKFFSIISHDLKNPINVLYATTDILAKNFEKFQAEKINMYLQNMNISSKTLINLLENLLSWANLQTGAIITDKQKSPISEIILKNIDLFNNVADNKNIELVADIEDDIYIIIDRNMIDTVIRNLISNALKFTHSGGQVFVTLKKYKDYIEVAVKDTGIGIEKEFLGDLFQIGNRKSSLGTEEEKGTGLGLILCKEFIEKHDGKISVESKIGKGSIFLFTLPIT
jgi:signal transduction histidine kinase